MPNDAALAPGFTLTDTPPAESDDDVVARLAKLPSLEYERVRATEAERLSCRAAILDKLVNAARDGADPARYLLTPVWIAVG